MNETRQFTIFLLAVICIGIGTISYIYWKSEIRNPDKRTWLSFFRWIIITKIAIWTAQVVALFAMGLLAEWWAIIPISIIGWTISAASMIGWGEWKFQADKRNADNYKQGNGNG